MIFLLVVLKYCYVYSLRESCLRTSNVSGHRFLTFLTHLAPPQPEWVLCFIFPQLGLLVGQHSDQFDCQL